MAWRGKVDSLLDIALPATGQRDEMGAMARAVEVFRRSMIEARDLNAAIQIAAQMPQARGGPIEVREDDGRMSAWVGGL